MGLGPGPLGDDSEHASLGRKVTWRRGVLAAVSWALIAAAIVSAEGCGAAFSSGTPGDAGVEATTADVGGNPGQGNADAGNGDGGTEGFCATLTGTYVLCDDFDDREGSSTAVLAGTWDGVTVDVDAGAKMAIDNEAPSPPSSPNTLLVETTTSINGEETLALLTKDLGSLPNGSKVIASFDANVLGYGTGGSTNPAVAAAVFDIVVGSLVTYSLVVDAGNVAVFLEQGTNPLDGGVTRPSSNPLSAGLGMSTWQKVTITLTLPTLTKPAHIHIVLGEMVVLDADLNVRADVSQSKVAVLLGLSLDDSPNSWAIRYDNVVLSTSN